MATMIPYGNVRGVIVYSQAINPASVSANTSAEQTFTVTGVQVGDFVIAQKPSVDAGLIVGSARVTAADTVGITFGNLTGSPIDAGSETWKFVIFRPDNGSAQTNAVF